MPKPACAKCQRFLRPLRNGIDVLEGKPANGALPGTAEPDLWSPYKVWHADLWRCEGCGVEIISGWGGGPWMDDYRNTPEEMQTAASHRVNDC